MRFKFNDLKHLYFLCTYKKGLGIMQCNFLIYFITYMSVLSGHDPDKNQTSYIPFGNRMSAFYLKSYIYAYKIHI